MFQDIQIGFRKTLIPGEASFLLDSKSCQTIDYGKRSSGDGDSSIEDSNLSFKHQKEREFLMARRPDGKTDDNTYATLRWEAHIKLDFYEQVKWFFFSL